MYDIFVDVKDPQDRQDLGGDAGRPLTAKAERGCRALAMQWTASMHVIKPRVMVYAIQLCIWKDLRIQVVEINDGGYSALTPAARGYK